MVGGDWPIWAGGPGGARTPRAWIQPQHLAATRLSPFQCSFPVHGHLILGGGDKLGSQNSAGLKHTPLSDV